MSFDSGPRSFAINLGCGMSRILGLLTGIMMGQAIHAQVIPSVVDREALIRRLLVSVSQNEPVEVEDELRSPFREGALEEPLLALESPEIELDEALALEWIAEAFRPTGSLLKGGRGYLLLEGGGRIEEGGEFDARIRDESYRVKVEMVSERSYQLRLGGAVWEGLFENQEGR